MDAETNLDLDTDAAGIAALRDAQAWLFDLDNTLIETHIDFISCR